MQKLIKSSNIFPDSTSEPFSGYILVKGDYIEELIPENSIDLDLLQSCDLLDFKDLYIIPGLIDLNVCLNSNYDEEWVDIENITKMAAQGGITTIIENPLLCNYNEEYNEMEAIKKRIGNLQENIYVDCGLLALLSSHNFNKIEEIWQSNLVLGFKMYLSLNIQYNMPQLEPKKDLKKLREIILKSKFCDFFFSIHPECASTRDLFMCSPLRGYPKEKRLDLTEEIKDEGT